MATTKIPQQSSGGYIVQEQSVSTTANGNVSPFGAFASASFTAPSGYTLASALLVNTTTTNPAEARAANNSAVYCYSKSAATFTLRLLFVLGGGN